MAKSILSLLNSEQKKQLKRVETIEELTSGHTLFYQNDDAKKMFLVKKGKVSLFRLMPSGDEKLFRVFLPGEIIAEMAMFMTPPTYPMTAKIEQDSILCAYSRESIINMVTASPELSLQVLNYMSNRISNLMNTLDILTQVNANQRFIMKLASIYKMQPQCEGEVHLAVTKKLLATQLGMTPETLSRVIGKLKKDNLLRESGNHLVLPNIQLLCESANLSTDLFK